MNTIILENNFISILPYFCKGVKMETHETFVIHFNVPNHYLPLDDFIETAKDAAIIIDAFNAKYFDRKLDYQLLVIPPEQGTFKSFIGFVILSSAVVFHEIVSDFTKGFIEGITNKDPKEWGIIFGDEIEDIFSMDEREASDQEKKKCVANLLSESAKGFLSKDNNELRSIGISTTEFRDAFIARNQFYNTCINNPEIESIGFDNSDQFPTPRRDFPNFIVDVPPAPSKEELEVWSHEIAYIKVTSPNWDRKDQQRDWKAKDQHNRAVYFRIEDENFWLRVKIEKLSLHAVDRLKVQWAFIKERSRRLNIRVLRVLEFNGDHISDPLTDHEITSLLVSSSESSDEPPKFL
jgi:hypothetical protein|tara:strand:- start:287 stop:1336 length:1050 start_codon:yes stop_codon:yes gene_type:complete